MTPEVKILTVVKDVLEAVDWAWIGFPAMLVRHRRNRPSTAEEGVGGCIAIRYLSDAPREDQSQGGYLTPDEMAVSMALAFEIDLPLPPEVTAEDAAAGVEDLDPTGLLGVTTISGAIKRALKAEDSMLRQWADFAEYEGQSGDQDQNTEDQGRLDLSMGVIYRVDTTDPTRLLAQGEQA
jgi:hypothetical protein